jgi:hypothetical protein
MPEGQRLWDHATQAEPLGEIRFTLHARQRQKAREVHQQIWSRQIDLPDAEGGVRLGRDSLKIRHMSA